MYFFKESKINNLSNKNTEIKHDRNINTDRNINIERNININRNINMNGNNISGENYLNFQNKPPQIENLYKPNHSILLDDNKNPFDNNIIKNIDPYKVLDLPENCNIDELKIAYRKLSLKHHPDKGGDINIFNIINEAYHKINMRLTSIQPKQKVEHNDLKKMSKKNETFFPKINSKKMTGKNFNSDKFNDIFNKNKQSNPYDKGYSDWNEDIKDENIPVSNNNSFNEVFEQSRKKNNYSKQIQKIDEPKPQILCDLQFQELGVDEVNSFSKTDGDSNNINFTDYRDAYTTESKFINPNEVNIDRPESLNKLKNNRENISYQMNEQQKEAEKLRQQQYEQDEYNRMQRVSVFDEIANEHFNKVNQLMLGK